MGKVKISELAEEMDMQVDEFKTFVHRESGKIYTVSKESFKLAEEEPKEKQKEPEDVKLALDIFNNFEKYAELPDQYEINEYKMMEQFSFLQEAETQDQLLRAISGRGAFGRFKDLIIDLGIRDEWFAYRYGCYKKIAIEFCEHYNIPYETENSGE